MFHNVHCQLMHVAGTIPSELCNTISLYLDVADTNIHCYSGCLTSARIIIVGASNICPNGSIMELFVIAIAVCCFLSLTAALWYKYFRKSNVISSCFPSINLRLCNGYVCFVFSDLFYHIGFC